MESVLVRTGAGVVRGRVEDGLSVFRGVPFAQAPVGALRFAAPARVVGWEGVRETTSFGPPVPQELGIRGIEGRLDAPEGDDWLTVNVWTPAADPQARRAVLVWVYGGAYKLGWAGSPGYDARRIAREGEIVVVSLNYRVGIEGFAQIEGAPANRGLLDQVAALEWVRENIAAFGGDPEQVTVVGESAGAGSVAALLAMPAAAGLFRRAVAQSLPGTFFTRELAADIGAAIAAELGLRATVADLSTVAPRELPAAGASMSVKMRERVDRWGVVAQTLTPFSPVVDGEVLPVAPWEALAGGSARDVDVIFGHNRNECRLFIALSGQLGKVDDAMAAEALRAFAPGEDGEAAYRAAYPDADAATLFEVVQSDWLFRMPMLRLADAQVAGGGRARVYELTWDTPGSGGIFGACHGLDGPLLFGTLDAHLGPMLFGPEPSAEAVALSAFFRRSWIDFATSGDPGWPAYDPQRRLVRLFDAEPTVAPYPEEASRRLWAGHPFGALPLVGA